LLKEDEMLNDGKKLTPQELMDDVKRNSGKAGGWPNYFGYFLNGDSITICVDNKILDKKATRRLDPWGLAFLISAESRCRIRISTINFAMSGEIDEIEPHGRLFPDLEAFRRRVSFLSINNPDIQFVITANGVSLELDDVSKLFNRPDNEKTRETLEHIPQDNHPGRLEKDFQTWLFANEVKGEHKAANTNERLAVLGDDFFKLKNKTFGIDREFPTGVFYDKISNSTRVLPTEFVDIVTLNKYGQLAVIELKLNDSQLEVIAQILDYSLFFRCYINKLLPIIKGRLGHAPKGKDIVCYVVNNHFHNRFDDVIKFYSPKNESYGFRIRKVVLGHY
jgi:hypothetical protein